MKLLKIFLGIAAFLALWFGGSFIISIALFLIFDVKIGVGVSSVILYLLVCGPMWLDMIMDFQLIGDRLYPKIYGLVEWIKK